MQKWEKEFLEYMHSSYPQIFENLVKELKLNDAIEAELKTAIQVFNDTHTELVPVAEEE